MATLSRTGLSVLVATSTLLVVSSSRAEPCNVNDGYCSSGELPQAIASDQRLPGKIDTGWWPKCNPGTADGHCESEKVQFRAQIAFDKPKTGNSVYSIEIPRGGIVDARWPTSEFFDLTLTPGGATDGTFRVSHTLTPEISLFVRLPPFYTGKIDFDSTSLINLLPGSQFAYLAAGSKKFQPWGFEKTELVVEGKDINQSRLFAVTFQQLENLITSGSGGSLTDIVQGNFSFNATTRTKFTYETSRVEFIGATGPINEATGTTQVFIDGGDYVELQGNIVGQMRYEGVIEFLPAISITQVGNIPFSITFPIHLGLEVDYGSGSFVVNFPAQTVHIPLPNVFVYSTPLSFPSTQTGTKSETRKIIIDSTGEMPAELSFSSSDPAQFKLSSSSRVMGQGERFELGVTFHAYTPGTQSATITVTSNDPDEPVQTVFVSGVAWGDKIEPPPEEQCSGRGCSEPTRRSSSATDDGGCGCGVVSSSAHTWGLSSLFLGLVAFGLRRLRRQHS